MLPQPVHRPIHPVPAQGVDHQQIEIDLAANRTPSSVMPKHILTKRVYPVLRTLPRSIVNLIMWLLHLAHSQS